MPDAPLPSLHRRLARAVLVVALAWGLAVSGVVWLAVRHEVDELLDDSLRAAAEVLKSLLERDADAMLAAGPRALPDTAGGARFAWQLVDAAPAVLLRSAQAPAVPWLPAAQSGFSNAVAGWRVYGVALDRQRTLYVAQSRAERREALAEVSASSVVAALAVGLAAVLWLRTRVRRELVPLAELSASLARYEPLQADAGLPAPARAELAPVQDAVLALGRRLAQRVASERAFAAHAAHALRTPLAGIDAQLAVALREAPPDLAPRLQRVRLAAGRLSHVVSALLALFRSGVRLQRQPIDVALLLSRLPVEGLMLEVGAGTVDADPDLLAAALLNLLDNALRHGARRVRVSVEHARVTVADDGPGVDAERRASIERLLARQGDGEPEGGIGLGLVLADLVARAHGGGLRLPPAPSGFVAVLDLAPAQNGAP